MSGSVNKVILVGNLGADPDIRRRQDGEPIANFSLATSESWRDKNTGERKEKTEWHRIVVFPPLSKVVEQYVVKGQKLYIEGKLQTRKWEKDGIERYSTEVVLTGFNTTLTMLDKPAAREEQQDQTEERPARNGYAEGHGKAQPSGTGGRPQRQSGFKDNSDMDDDIPF